MQKRRVDRNKNREKVLTFLTEFVRQHGYNPSIREICQALGLKSSSTVYNHLRRLKEEGVDRDLSAEVAHAGQFTCAAKRRCYLMRKTLPLAGKGSVAPSGIR